MWREVLKDGEVQKVMRKVKVKYKHRQSTSALRQRVTRVEVEVKRHLRSLSDLE